jgi:polysaccharide deacetylase family protein (PEP-CTERM system associated)
MIQPKSAVTHHFTVDVEEYFQVSALEPWVPRARWGSFESRVVHSTLRLSRLLNDHDSRATFFVLGWVAEREPELIRKLAAAGHEIASHGWDHRRVTEQNRSEFRASVRRTKQLLEDLTGTPVIGFRAPSFSIVPGLEWALDILIDEGYQYDSSLFPVMRRGYGYARGRRDPHWLMRPGGALAEIPPATVRRMGVNFPAAGGAYLRLLPVGLVRTALLDSDRRGVPATFYIHPWEIDPDQPRVATSWPTRFRHYGGLARTANRLVRLLQEFRFQPIAKTIAALPRD